MSIPKDRGHIVLATAPYNRCHIREAKVIHCILSSQQFQRQMVTQGKGEVVEGMKGKKFSTSISMMMALQIW